MAGVKVLILTKAVVCTQLYNLGNHTGSAVRQMSNTLLEHRQTPINGSHLSKKQTKTRQNP